MPKFPYVDYLLYRAGFRSNWKHIRWLRKGVAWSIAVLLIFYIATFPFVNWRTFYRLQRLNEWSVFRWKCLDFLEPLATTAAHPSSHASREVFYISHSLYPGVGVGNLMFFYASLWGIARRNNLTIAIAHTPLHDNVTLDEDTQKDFDLSACGNLVFGMEECCMYDPRTEQLFDSANSPRTNVTLWGYFQSWKYFHPHYKNDIQRQLAFKPEVSERGDFVRAQILEQIYQKLAPNENRSRPVVGIHIRRGDVLSAKHLKSGHMDIKKTYFENAELALAKKGVVNPVYIVCTNDPEWAVDNLPFPLMGVVTNESAYVDLYILTKSDHLILSYGTFSFFAGYLSNAENVIYFANWPRPGSVLDDQTKLEEYWLPEWIGVGD